MTGTATSQDVIRQVIRGERPWTELRTVGIVIHLEGDQCRIENPQGIKAAADLHDLAQGLLVSRNDSNALRTWAFVLEAESFVDWGEAEQDPAWEPLWDAVWGASFGEPIPPEAIETARQLA